MEDYDGETLLIKTNDIKNKLKVLMEFFSNHYYDNRIIILETYL